MKIILVNNKGKSWKQFENGFIKGFTFLNNKLLMEHEIYHVLYEAFRANKLNQKLHELNGNFSGVIQFQDSTYLFSDKLKTYPLLYTTIGGEWLVSDQSRIILDALPEYNPNEDAIMTYLALGYLHGNHTFLNNCNIVAAGTYVKLNQSATVHEYHKHIYKKVNISDEEIMEGCVTSMENAIKRMITSIGNRPIWIPLSGGYDSRLLACVCKKLDVKNVGCFTYGIPESYEVKISKQVAKTLGFPWYYIEYTKEKFLSVANSPVDDDYILWAMNLNTTSHYQDFIAFKELKDKGVIEDKAVIVPGHSGEILGRDQIPYNLLGTKKSVADLIFYRYFTWNTLKSKYTKRALDFLGPTYNSTIVKEDKGLTVDLFTNWNIQNRQANFIINAIRVYEYFGNDWRIPLWDDELSEFWFSLTWIKNSNVELYNRFLFKKYFIPMGVEFYKETNVSKKWIARIRLPFNLKSMIKKEISKLNYFKSRYDYNGFNYRADYYLNKLNNFSSPYILLKKANTNAVIAQYQIFLLKKYFEESNKS